MYIPKVHTRESLLFLYVKYYGLLGTTAISLLQELPNDYYTPLAQSEREQRQRMGRGLGGMDKTQST